MTAAAPAASPSVSARSHQQHPSSVSSWPLPDDPLPPSETGTVTKSSLEDEEAHAGGILPQAGGQVNHGQLNHPQESSSLSPPPPPITNKTVVPWWRTRKAKIAYGVGAALLVVLVILLVLGLLGYLRKPGQDPVVNLGYATYAGTTLSGGINRFLGMRYAAAPVGDLRWRAPAPAPTVTGTQQAKSFGPICLGISVSFPTSSEDEDCLFINVWAPEGANTTTNLPVWLFIQGGGYVSNSNANWNGATVVEQSGNKVVFVNFNYRVAMWGFLASQKVQANGNLNAGLLDQRLAMQWVKQNIASFGGDPNNVIIHGASAGAGSVAMHLTAFGGRNDNLFSAAIAESVFFPAQPLVPQLEYQFDALTNATGCSATADPLACLRSKPTADLQAQNIPSPFPGRTASPVPLFYWTPCVDGDFIQDLPYNLLASGKFIRDIPLLFGNDNDEGSGFATNAATPDDMANFLQNNYPLLTTDDTDAIASMYPLLPALPQHEAYFPSTSMAYGEATFICPAITLLAAYQSLDANATTPQLWNYRYNVLDDNNVAQGLGVPHLWESYAVFGPRNLANAAAPESYLTYNAEMVPLVMGYFLSFVMAHDPNPVRAVGAPVWEAWGTTGQRIVMETNATRMEVVGDEQKARCAFWAGLAERTQQKRDFSGEAGR